MEEEGSMTLHTQYRPIKFEQVIGQDEVIKSIKSTLKNKTNRAFLLIGPAGVGKTTIARIIGKKIGAETQNIKEIDAAYGTNIAGTLFDAIEKRLAEK